MKRFFGWRTGLAAGLIVLSATVYFIHYLVFRDARNLVFYTVMDVAFLFVQVLLVTILFTSLMDRWESSRRMAKVNMAVEVFFSEFGRPLLGYLSRHDGSLDSIRDAIGARTGVTSLDTSAARGAVCGYRSDLVMAGIDQGMLKRYLTERRGFLVSLLQNPNLLEHEAFTDMLMAVFHLVEEYASRDMDRITEDDRKHLKTDLQRAYDALTVQWIAYLDYIKTAYPYYFVFALRTNPYLAGTDSLER
jgi:hypothetical protein